MTKTENYKIKGMHCASCAIVIEKTLKKVAGVIGAEANYGTESVKLAFDESKTNPQQLSEQIESLGYSLIITEAVGTSLAAKDDKLVELATMKKQISSVVPLAVISILIMTWETLASFRFLPEMLPVVAGFFHHLLPIMATVVFVMIGGPYLLGLYRFLRYGKANMDTLIGIGTVTAFLYSFVISAFEGPLAAFLNVEHNYYDVVIVVITFVAWGKYLEMRSKLATGDAIEKLLNLQAKTALVLRAGVEVEIKIEEVASGEVIVVKPAGKIPVDGVLVSGSSYVDESMISGEPMPVLKNIGDEVLAGTMNTSGAFTMRATKVGAETMLASIIKMVEEAQGSRAPIQALADKISAVFVPIVLVLAFVTLGLWLGVGAGYLGFSQALSNGLVSFVGILVIACPCALGLATPTAIIVGVGKGARAGILIKDAASLQKLHQVDTVVVDKTGTITRGKPELVSVQNLSDRSDEELIGLLASLENKSEHPIAEAIIHYARDKKIAVSNLESFEALKGKGLRGGIGGVEYYAGNVHLMTELGLAVDKKWIEKETKEGKTPIILASKDQLLAVMMVADAIKDGAKEAVSELSKLGIAVVMLTGDDKNTAQYIAEQVGIAEVAAELMPVDKLSKIKELQAQGKVVAMAGDGVNDAPALAAADVGIAMATGTDVAIASAGIILLHGDIAKLTKAIKLSKMTMRGIKQNLFWAFVYNIVGIPLAAGLFYPVFGWLLSPVWAGMAMALSSVSVVTNSLRIKSRKL